VPVREPYGAPDPSGETTGGRFGTSRLRESAGPSERKHHHATRTQGQCTPPQTQTRPQSRQGLPRCRIAKVSSRAPGHLSRRSQRHNRSQETQARFPATLDHQDQRRLPATRNPVLPLDVRTGPGRYKNQPEDAQRTGDLRSVRLRRDPQEGGARNARQVTPGQSGYPISIHVAHRRTRKTRRDRTGGTR